MDMRFEDLEAKFDALAADIDEMIKRQVRMREHCSRLLLVCKATLQSALSQGGHIGESDINELIRVIHHIEDDDE